MTANDLITVLIPTSPIPSHPSTAIIEKAINSVRRHLPKAHIQIMIDGIRPEQEHYRASYGEYLRNLVGTCMEKYKKVYLLPYTRFLHQAQMTKASLGIVMTPLILFMEHDTFFIEGDIDWEGICRVILAGDANMVGFHCQSEPWIIPEHEHLMIDKQRNYFQGVPMLRTWQWSQRPHVASTDFYRRILNAYFRPEFRTMIEDQMYNTVLTSREIQGEDGWHEWKMMYYAPEGNIRRTDTVDGRGDDPKYPMTF